MNSKLWTFITFTDFIAEMGLKYFKNCHSKMNLILQKYFFILFRLRAFITIKFVLHKILSGKVWNWSNIDLFCLILTCYLIELGFDFQSRRQWRLWCPRWDWRRSYYRRLQWCWPGLTRHWELTRWCRTTDSTPCGTRRCLTPAGTDT